MTIADGEIIRTSARFKNADSGDIVNVFHWKAEGTGSATEDAIMTAIEAKLDAAYAFLASHMWSGQDPYDVRHDVVSWVGGKETVLETLGTRTWTLTTPPSGGTDAMPQMDAAIVNFRTLLPKTFGRKYIGGLLEAGQNGGVLTSTVVSALTSFGAAILADIVSGTITLKPGVVTYKTTFSALHWVPFAAAIVNSVIGTQRRRRINRGS